MASKPFTKFAWMMKGKTVGKKKGLTKNLKKEPKGIKYHHFSILIAPNHSKSEVVGDPNLAPWEQQTTTYNDNADSIDHDNSCMFGIAM